MSGTDWPNKGEFEFSFWPSLYAEDPATALGSRDIPLVATGASDAHLMKFGRRFARGCTKCQHHREAETPRFHMGEPEYSTKANKQPPLT